MQTDTRQRATLRRILMGLLLVALPSIAISASGSEFEKFDINNDRALSASEFLSAKYSIADFKAADSNKNQQVSVAEFASFLNALSKPKKRQSSGPHPPHG